MKYNKQLDNYMELTRKGRKVWLAKLKDFQINIDDTVILILNNSSEFNYYTLLYLNSINLDKKGYLLTTDEKVYKAYNFFTNNIECCIYLTNEEAEAIVNFYNLYMFTDNLLIFSPTLPKSRTSYNLVQSGQIDVEELISVGIYKNKEFKRLPLVEYHGDDLDLIDFFNIKREGEAF